MREIAQIRAGHQFRGAVEEDQSGNSYVVQVRDIGIDGDISWDSLARTTLAGKKTPGWLEAGDVIFSARGKRNIAAVVPDKIADLDVPVVCGPHFLRISILDKDQVIPRFLTWQLNSENLQRYFRASAQGSAQVSISRRNLELAPVVVPDLKTQKSVVALQDLVQREERVMRKLIDLRWDEFEGLAKKIISNQTNKKLDSNATN